MSLVYTIPQLLAMAEGGIPEAFKGKIKKVWQVRSGTNDHGPWTLQTVVITDGTADIDLSFSDREPVQQSAVGQTLYVQATKGDRGLQGVKRKDYTPAGKPTKQQVSVTPAADVTFEGAAPQSRSAAPAQVQHHTNQNPTPNGDGNPPVTRSVAGNNQSPSTQGATKDELIRTEIKRFNIRIGKTQSALNRCFDAAIKLTKDLSQRHPDLKLVFTATDIKEIAISMMVNSCWTEKPADVLDFPTKPFQSYEVKATGTENGQPPANGAPFQ